MRDDSNPSQSGHPIGRAAAESLVPLMCSYVQVTNIPALLGISARAFSQMCALGEFPCEQVRLSERGSGMVRAEPFRAFLADWIPPTVTPSGRPEWLVTDRTVGGKRGWVYFLEASTGEIKIGRTGFLEQRLTTHRCSNAREMVLLGLLRGESKEADLHQRFGRYRIKDEWFHATEEIHTYVQTNCIVIYQNLSDFLDAMKAANPSRRDAPIPRKLVLPAAA